MVMCGRGPDTYEQEENCPACNGTGSGNMADAINALGYWKLRTNIERIVIERAAVLQIIEASASGLAAEVERLKVKADEQGRIACELFDALKAAQVKLAKRDAEVEELRTDAERYTALRTQTWYDGVVAVVRDPRRSVKLGYDCPSHERLDELADELRKKV